MFTFNASTNGLYSYTRLYFICDVALGGIWEHTEAEKKLTPLCRWNLDFNFLIECIESSNFIATYFQRSN